MSAPLNGQHATLDHEPSPPFSTDDLPSCSRTDDAVKANHIEVTSCAGVQDAPLQQQATYHLTESESASDISLSSQKTLKYCDVGSPGTAAEQSLESSDSAEVLAISQSDDQDLMSSLEKITVTRNVMKRSSVADNTNVDRSSVSSEGFEVTLPEVSSAPRPESLSLVHTNQDLQQEQKKSNSRDRKHSGGKSYQESDLKNSLKSDIKIKPTAGDMSQESGGYLADTDDCMTQHLPQGTITRKGDMIQFVADDLVEKIKKSSPLSHADTGSTGSRRSSVRSTTSSTSAATSSGVSRSPSSLFQQSPDDIPPIDAAAVVDLENQARRVADSLDLMMGNIRNNLHKMSAITIGCQEAYKRSVDITCDSVDASIKSMYTLMAKCEELSSAMKPVEQLAVQIREIKRILDLFETQMVDK